MESSCEETVLLEALLSIHPKSSPVFRVCVSSTQISFLPSEEEHESRRGRNKPVGRIYFSDVVGCECAKGKSSADASAYLTIYAYPHTKKFGSKKTSRKRHVVTLTFGKGKDFEENHAVALKWKIVLSNLIRNIEIPGSEAMLSTLQPPSSMTVLVLVNPFSGPGKALHIFQQRIVPVLAEAGIQYQLKITEYAGHAKEIAKSLTLDEWYGILIVSGDGLIFEVVNGLMERSDWEKAIKLPLGVLPGGSGNALCCSLLYRVKEPYLDNCVLHATFMVAKHTVAPMDLVAVDLSSGRRLYSFLSVGWGMIADVDIESEKYRSLGNSRFALGALIRIVGLRKYRGRLSFLPVDENYRLMRSHSYDDQRLRDSAITQHPEDSCQRSVSLFEAVSGNAGKAGMKIEKKISGDAGKTSSRKPAGKGTAGKDPAHKESFGEARGDHDTAAAPKPDESSGSQAMAVKTPLLAALREPVPASWTTIEDDFILFVALYQTHIAQDMVAAPDSKLDDGIIYLLFLRGNVSRIKLIQLLNALQEAEPPVDDPHVNIVKVRAFRLEPLTETGTMTVDGEVVEYGPIQAQVLPSVARVMTFCKNE